MNFESSIIANLNQAYKAATPGVGVEVPEAVLPVASLCAPLSPQFGLTTSLIDLRNGNSSAFAEAVVANGASTAAAIMPMLILDKGLWELTLRLLTFTDFQPAAAAIPLTGIYLYDPTQTNAVQLVSVGGAANVNMQANERMIVNLSLAGYQINSFSIGTGVGQTSSVQAFCYARKLM